jgi:Tfp pilus assembly protein PilV
MAYGGETFAYLMIMNRKVEVRSGLSLIEVVVTMTLVIVLTLGLYSAQSLSTSSRNFTRERDLAREAAQAKLEEILSVSFDGLSGTYGPVNAAPSTTGADDTPTTFAVPGFQKANGLNLAVTEWLAGQANMPAASAQLHGLILLDDATAPATAGVLMRITVRVRWVSSDQTVQQVELTTLRANEAS